MENPQDDENYDGTPPTDAPLNGQAEHSDEYQGDAEVWQSFEQSVAYMTSLSTLYQDAFLSPNPKKATITATHIEAAKGHAREAMELLASNLLNASAAIVASMESQDEQLLALTQKLDNVTTRLQERQQASDHQVIQRFFESSISTATNQIEKDLVPGTIGDKSPASLKLSLTGTATSTASSYLYM